MQQQMYHYHANLVATHPYASVWWQWPLLDKPILYYANYTHVMTPHGECCTSTIRAIPNPLVWWSGLVSVPAVAWLAWRERNKGYALLVVAYLFQWLPWIRSPRLAFEYHFYPNLAIIILANAIVLQHVWNYGRDRGDVRGALRRRGVRGARRRRVRLFLPARVGLADHDGRLQRAHLEPALDLR